MTISYSEEIVEMFHPENLSTEVTKEAMRRRALWKNIDTSGAKTTKAKTSASVPVTLEKVSGGGTHINDLHVVQSGSFPSWVRATQLTKAPASEKVQTERNDSEDPMVKRGREIYEAAMKEKESKESTQIASLIEKVPVLAGSDSGYGKPPPKYMHFDQRNSDKPKNIPYNTHTDQIGIDPRTGGIRSVPPNKDGVKKSSLLEGVSNNPHSNQTGIDPRTGGIRSVPPKTANIRSGTKSI